MRRWLTAATIGGFAIGAAALAYVTLAASLGAASAVPGSGWQDCDDWRGFPPAGAPLVCDFRRT